MIISLPYLIINLLLFLLVFGQFYILFAQSTWEIINNPNDIWAFYNRATVRRQLGDRKGAISDFTESIRVRSANPKTLIRAASPYSKRAQEYYYLGEKNKALADYQKAAEIYQQHNEMEHYQQILNEIELIEKEDGHQNTVK